MTEVARLERGDVYRHVMSGGGGFGDPLERDPLRVLQDVIEEKISPAHAEEAYGVVIAVGAGDPTLDATATTARRSALRAAGGS
jgi:N-methylhydantoinase B